MFITLEGIEGSGKTSQLDYLADFFEGLGKDCLITREPGGTMIGDKIRAILLDPKNKQLVPAAELLLYLADRAQHAYSVIIPALSEGKIVICDRYVDATLVYQGMARGIGVEKIRQLHRLLIDNLMPEITFLLDLSPEVGLARAWRQIDSGERTGKESRFENEAMAFHQTIRDGYLKLAKLEPQRYCVIDAHQSEIAVREKIISTLRQLL